MLCCILHLNEESLYDVMCFIFARREEVLIVVDATADTKSANDVYRRHSICYCLIDSFIEYIN